MPFPWTKKLSERGKTAAPQQSAAAAPSAEDTFYDVVNSIYTHPPLTQEAMQEKIASSGVDVNAVFNGDILLHYAVRQSNTSAIDALITAGADINARDKDGNTPLLIAVDNTRPQKIELVKTLLRQGAKTDCARASDGKNIFHIASDHLKQAPKNIIITQLLSLFPDPSQALDGINAPDKNGDTPLHVATSFTGAEARIKRSFALLEKGANPDAQNSQGVRAIDVQDIEPDGTTDIGDTLLIAAIRRTHAPQDVTTLLTYGADPTKPNAQGSTPLEVAKHRFQNVPETIQAIERAVEQQQTTLAAQTGIIHGFPQGTVSRYFPNGPRSPGSQNPGGPGIG